MTGDVASVEAAVAVGSKVAGRDEILVDRAVIPSPARELFRVFVKQSRDGGSQLIAAMETTTPLLWLDAAKGLIGCNSNSSLSPSSRSRILVCSVALAFQMRAIPKSALRGQGCGSGWHPGGPRRDPIAGPRVVPRVYLTLAPRCAAEAAPEKPGPPTCQTVATCMLRRGMGTNSRFP